MIFIRAFSIQFKIEMKAHECVECIKRYIIRVVHIARILKNVECIKRYIRVVHIARILELLAV